MIRYWPALLSVLLSLGAVAGYYAFLRVPAIRNHPELYLVASEPVEAEGRGRS